MNIDCFFVYGLFLIPFFAYEQVKYARFDFSDFGWMGLFVLTVTIGTISLTKALEVGLAGPIQAIESLKTIWQTIATIFIFGQIPTFMQSMGCFVGIFGVIIMVVMKK